MIRGCLSCCATRSKGSNQHSKDHFRRLFGRLHRTSGNNGNTWGRTLLAPPRQPEVISIVSALAVGDLHGGGVAIGDGGLLEERHLTSAVLLLHLDFLERGRGQRLRKREALDLDGGSAQDICVHTIGAN